MGEVMLLLLFACFAFGAFSPSWSHNYPNSQYGQVDDVALANGTVFASLIADVTLQGFALSSGAPSWTHTSGRAQFGLAQAGGSLVCAMSANVSAVSVQCFRAVSGALMWTKVFPGAFDTQLLAVSHDGSTVAFGVGSLSASHVFSSSIYVTNAAGTILRNFSCPFNSTNGLLSLDPVGSTMAYTCFKVGSQVASVIVRDITAPASQAPLLQTTSSAASGTGFALSRHGTFFAYGVSETHVYVRPKNTAKYQLLFTRSPVNPLDARLLEAIAFDNSDAKPILATGYFTIDQQDQTQQSFMEVFDLSSSTPQNPIWVYRFANTTRPYQDSIADITFCGSGPQRVISVASWGLGPNSTQVLNAATVHSFVASSGSKILSYNTPGSMFGIVCSVQGSQLLVSAGGKHEHANVMGSGGDVFGFSQSLKKY